MINFKLKSNIKILFYLMVITGLCDAQTYLGDACNHQKKNTPGVCSLLSNCPSALADLRKQILPQTCSFDGTTPIVCCPTSGPATPKPTTQSPITEDPLAGKAPAGVGAKSIAKCLEYAKAVYVIKPRPTLVGGTQRNMTVNECGFKAAQLIVGGIKAKPKEFPHMAQVGYDAGTGATMYACGGSLISERFVLTAGHCLSTRNYGKAKYVRLGDLDTSTTTDEADVQVITVEEIIKHPDYRPPSQYNDIGLLKLQEQARFTAYVRPICLNTRYNFNEEKSLASGWGNTAYLGSSSDHLLKVTLDQFTHEECKQKYEPNRRQLANGILDNTQLCAGSKSERKDTCQGDSGGPLQVYHQEVYCMYLQIGVTSFGKACGVVSSPGVYSRVSYYIDWIEKTVWP